MSDRLFIFDTTLRDGEQVPGCQLNTVEKIQVAKQLEALGNVGEAVAVIVMVIQVAGAGGTFPIEVLPEVYQMIYKFLPFTYCMNALRECVG